MFIDCYIVKLEVSCFYNFNTFFEILSFYVNSRTKKMDICININYLKGLFYI